MAAIDVGIYGIPAHRRSTVCCQAMYAGIKASGDRPVLLMETAYKEPAHSVAVFYGYTATLRRIMADYVEAGLTAVYIDLGYWQREGLHGHHKIVVNARHPTAYFRKQRHAGDRARAVGVKVEPWRQGGRHILLAGMGAKAAEAEGKIVEAWEYDAIEWIRKFTSRPIVYRPKPSWLQARHIPGTIFSPKDENLGRILANACAVVTHHSNVAVEGLVAGVPAFCWKGVAEPMASQDVTKIESPFLPEGREQWAADIAYTQWNIAEMQAGLPWRHMKSEGLIP